MFIDYFGNYVKSLNLEEVGGISISLKDPFNISKMKENYIKDIHLDTSCRYFFSGKTEIQKLFFQILFRNNDIRNKTRFLNMRESEFEHYPIREILQCNPIFFNLNALRLECINNGALKPLADYKFNLFKNTKYIYFSTDKDNFYTKDNFESIISRASKLEYLAISKDFVPSINLKHLLITHAFSLSDGWGLSNTLCETLKLPKNDAIENLQVFYKVKPIEEISKFEESLKYVQKLSKKAFFKKYDLKSSKSYHVESYENLLNINKDIEEFRKFLLKTQRNLKEFQIKFHT